MRFKKNLFIFSNFNFLETNIFLLLISEMFSLFLLLLEWEIYIVRKRKLAKEDFKTSIQKDVSKQYHIAWGWGSWSCIISNINISIIVTSLSFISWASLLTFGELFSKFSFSIHIRRISFQNSLPPLKIWDKNIHFSFPSRKRRILLQISLSPLETWEMNFKFLFSFQNLKFL